MMKNKCYMLIVIAAWLLQAACVKAPDAVPQAKTEDRPLLTILKNNYAFSMFYTALQRTGMDKMLETKGPFTLLVPDNNAFAASGISTDSLLKMDTASLGKLVRYHIIPAGITYAGIPQTLDTPYPTLAGPAVYFSTPITDLKTIPLHINGVVVSKTDIPAANGYMMALNQVLRYPEVSVKAYLQKNPRYSYFTQALKQFGLLDKLEGTGPFVVLAPDNAAFIKNRLDQKTLAGIDTTTYQKFLFSAYVLSPNRFFLSDYLIDAKPRNAVIFQPEYVATFLSVYRGTEASFGIMSLDYLEIQAKTANPPYYGNPFIYGPKPKLTDPDHPAVNGVIHGLDDLALIPDSVKIHK